MMSSLLADGPPEPKKFRIDMAVDASLSPPSGAAQPIAGEAPLEGQSPAAPSSARSSNGSVVSSGSNDKDDDVDTGMTGNLLEMISKSLLGNVFKVEEPIQQSCSLSPSPKPTTPNMVPGALAVAQSPAAQLFAEIGRLQDDWSWHRNPAASIRSGGTNKQTPVWKYFVYNKAENLSRCIIGDCTYMLKGPHTSTLACHLKKHPLEYAEFQKLKTDYTKERHGGQMPPSPTSSTSTVSNGVPRPIKKKESRTDMTNMVSSLHSGPPASPMPNLVQNLLGMNPLQFMMNQQVPTSTSNISAAQAASHMLSQAGLTVTPSGQIVPSKKWRRDERRQRELESRLALALASSHVPAEALACPLWKELLETAQPKFSFPEDASMIEQLTQSHHGRLMQSIKSHISTTRKVCIVVEAVCVPVPNQEEPLQRLLVSATFPGYSGQKYEIQTVLLAFRPLAGAETASEAVTLTVDQILSEYEIPMEKVSRFITIGFRGANGVEGEVFEKQMDSFGERLVASFTLFLESSPVIDELRKTVFALIFAFVTKPEALQALNKAARGAVDLPLTEPFVVLAEAVLKIKEAVQMISDQGLVGTGMTEQQWTLLKAVCTASKFIRQACSGDVATVDGAIPAVRQLLLSLEKDPSLSCIAEELKQLIEVQLATVLDPSNEALDDTYILATALNPQLAVLLNEEQVAHAKKTLEKELRNRLPARNTGVDAFLNVINQSKMDLAANPLYADLLQQAADRIQQEKPPNRDRMAEAVVSSYFDEVLSGCAVESLLSPFAAARSFGNPFQPPLLFWQQASAQCPPLSELAQELLCIPVSPPSASRLLSLRPRDNPWQQPDPSLLLSHLDRSDRLERDLLLRANRSLLPKTY